MPQVNIRLSTGGVNAIARLTNFSRVVIPGGVRLISEQSARAFTSAARNNLMTRTRFHGKTPGQLSKSIKPRIVESGKRRKTYSITASAMSTQKGRPVDYAPMVEYGTKPHKVSMPVGSKGDYMATGWRGNIPKRKYAAFRTHHHPGARPMFFMRDAFNHIVGSWQRFFSLYENKTLSYLLR